MKKGNPNSNKKKIEKNLNQLKDQMGDIIKKLDVSDLDSADITKDLKEKIETSSPQELENIEKQLGIDNSMEEYIKDVDDNNIEVPYAIETITEEGENENEEEKSEEETVDSSFNITVSDDKMTATIDLVPSRGNGKPLSYGNIKMTIEKMGIVYGVNYDLLKKLVESVEETKDIKKGVIIAQGTPPEEGEDGEIEFHFSESEDVLLQDNNKKEDTLVE